MKPLNIAFSSFIQEIRSFFLSQNFIEIYAPPLTDLPCMEAHLQPFRIHSLDGVPGRYLFTSPEFYLKECLLTTPKADLQNGIFSFSYSFRHDPKSPIHRQAFLMLEWYGLEQTLESMKFFIQELLKKPIFEMTMRDCIQKYAEVDYYQIKTTQDWFELFKVKFPTLLIKGEQQTSPTDLAWDDYFHLLFLNYVEPHLKKYDFLFLTHYPSQCRALAKLTPNDPSSSLRAELFVKGIEIGNGYEECTALKDYEEIYQKSLIEKEKIYGHKLEANLSKLSFFKSLQINDLPKCSGMAIGVERLFQVLHNNNYFTSQW